MLLLSPYAGLLVDRFPKRKILLITQAGLGLTSVALGLLVFTGQAGLGEIVVLALLFSRTGWGCWRGLRLAGIEPVRLVSRRHR